MFCQTKEAVPVCWTKGPFPIALGRSFCHGHVYFGLHQSTTLLPHTSLYSYSIKGKQHSYFTERKWQLCAEQ